MNKIKRSITLIAVLNIMAITIGWLGYILGNESIVKLVVLIIIPSISLISGVITSKEYIPIWKIILISISSVFLTIRKIIPFSVLGTVLAVFFVFVGYWCYNYYIYQNTIIENIDKNNKSEKNRVLLNRNLKLLPLEVSIVFSLLTLATLTIIAIFSIDSHSIGTKILVFVSTVWTIFDFWIIKLIVFIQGLVSSYNKMNVVEIVLPIYIVVGVVFWFIITGSIAIVITKVFYLVIYTLVGVFVGKLLYKIKNMQK